MSAAEEPRLVDDGLEGLTYRVIGLARAVHNKLGPGHREATYHNAMSQRLVDSLQRRQVGDLRGFQAAKSRVCDDVLPTGSRLVILPR